jgi:CyaY protein
MEHHMTESEYHHLADVTLNHLEAALDTAGIDYERGEGGVLELEFDDESMIVVNKQAAAREIWVAARSGGFHYRWDGAAWRDSRGGEELFTALARLAGLQSGVDIVLS